MATFPLITANDDQFPAVWHTGPVDVDGNDQPITSNTFDPLFFQRILIMQRGVLVDTSQYEHTLSIQFSGVTTLVAAPEVPGSLAIRINGFHNGGGVLITPSVSGATVFNQASKGRCWEGFIKPATGSRPSGSQVTYNDDFGFNGNVVAPAVVTTGKLFIRNNSLVDVIAPVEVAPLAENVWSYFIIQEYPTDVSSPSTSDKIRFWSGTVASGVLVGFTSLAVVPAPIASVVAGPYIGYVGGSGGVNDYILGPYRISDGIAYGISENNMAIPTELYQEA